ncbi:hypothetical protein M405DRAFT_825817 [Rhizopogon salebrosus TDB-379]|nr:hypothetical protein M405DRAFT_825817 [Rhizopogon salebrosus TDB-379]
MVAGAGVKLTSVLMCLWHPCLDSCKFFHGGWSWNEADCLDVLVASLTSQQDPFNCHVICSHLLYVSISYAIVFHPHGATNYMLKAMDYEYNGGIANIHNQVQSAVTHSVKWPFGALTQTIQLGIGDTLHFSFTLSQQGEQDVGKTLALAAGEYMTSQTQAAVKEAVNEVLHKDDGEDDKLSKMIIDIILKNCMYKQRSKKQESSAYKAHRTESGWPDEKQLMWSLGSV